MKLKLLFIIASLTLFTVVTYGQEKTILKGIVIDGKRNPIPAIGVSIKGTKTAAMTDSCGKFSLPIDQSTFILVFQGMSYDDLRTFEIKLTNTDIEDDFCLFQLGHWTQKNEACKSSISKKAKKHVIN